MAVGGEPAPRAATRGGVEPRRAAAQVWAHRRRALQVVGVGGRQLPRGSAEGLVVGVREPSHGPAARGCGQRRAADRAAAGGVGGRGSPCGSAAGGVGERRAAADGARGGLPRAARGVAPAAAQRWARNVRRGVPGGAAARQDDGRSGRGWRRGRRWGGRGCYYGEGESVRACPAVWGRC